jgi:hypothetical protein
MKDKCCLHKNPNPRICPVCRDISLGRLRDIPGVYQRFLCEVAPTRDTPVTSGQINPNPHPPRPRPKVTTAQVTLTPVVEVTREGAGDDEPPCRYLAKDPARIPGAVKDYRACAKGYGRSPGLGLPVVVCPCLVTPNGCINCPDKEPASDY